MGVPIGPVGCSIAQDSSGSNAKKWLASLAFGSFWSSLNFENNEKPIIHQKAIITEVTYQFTDKFIFGIGVGAIIDGEFKKSVYQTDIQRGGLVSVKGMWVQTFENPKLPFIITSFSFTASNVNAKSQSGTYNDFIGTDFRLGLNMGYTIRKIVQVYISPKVFGGPIFYKSNTVTLQGRDQYFFQVGLGVSVLFLKNFTLFINGSVAGERAISSGIAKGF